MSALLTPQTAVVPPVAPLASTSTEKHPETGVVPYRFTVEEYYKLGEVGILTAESRVELIDGLIVCKPMQNPPHSFVIRELVLFMVRLNGPDWTVQSQLPIDFASSVPEPDIAVLIGPSSRYRGRHVEVAEVRLVVEISDSTLVFDSTTKARLYAQNLIPVYWIVNIPDSRIEVYSTPTGGESAQYSQRTDFVAGQSVPVVLDGVTVAELAVTDLFG